MVFPAESALLRLVGEQKKLAHESIVTRIADSFSPEMAETINRLLDIQSGETVSALQKIKANPSKSSAPAMADVVVRVGTIFCSTSGPLRVTTGTTKILERSH